MNTNVPTVKAIETARRQLGTRVRETPVWSWQGREIAAAVGDSTKVFLKMELFQYGGTFKPRGALLNTLALTDDALDRGVVAVSAGNHAIATAFAAQAVGTSAKVVMPKTANPARVALSRAYGAEVILAEDTHEAFERVEHLQSEEKRSFIHPLMGNGRYSVRPPSPMSGAARWNISMR